MNTQRTSIDVTELIADLTLRQQAIEPQHLAMLQATQDALKHWDRAEAERHFRHCLEWNRMQELVSNWLKSVANETPLTYAVDSWFLQDVIRYLTTGQDEEITHVTGVRLGNVRMFSRLCCIEAEEKSPVYVKADAKSCADTEIEILEHGNLLHAMAHSHPGRGSSATRPSSIDINYLGRIQKAGSEAVGIIITRDGFVRFFTVLKPFRVLVTGSGVTQMEEYVYQIALPHTNRHQKGLLAG